MSANAGSPRARDGVGRTWRRRDPLVSGWLEGGGTKGGAWTGGGGISLWVLLRVSSAAEGRCSISRLVEEAWIDGQKG